MEENESNNNNNNSVVIITNNDNDDDDAMDIDAPSSHIDIIDDPMQVDHPTENTANKKKKKRKKKKKKTTPRFHLPYERKWAIDEIAYGELNLEWTARLSKIRENGTDVIATVIMICIDTLQSCDYIETFVTSDAYIELTFNELTSILNELRLFYKRAWYIHVSIRDNIHPTSAYEVRAILRLAWLAYTRSYMYYQQIRDIHQDIWSSREEEEEEEEIGNKSISHIFERWTTSLIHTGESNIYINTISDRQLLLFKSGMFSEYNIRELMLMVSLVNNAIFTYGWGIGMVDLLNALIARYCHIIQHPTSCGQPITTSYTSKSDEAAIFDDEHLGDDDNDDDDANLLDEKPLISDEDELEILYECTGDFMPRSHHDVAQELLPVFVSKSFIDIGERVFFYWTWQMNALANLCGSKSPLKQATFLMQYMTPEWHHWRTNEGMLYFRRTVVAILDNTLYRNNITERVTTDFFHTHLIPGEREQYIMDNVDETNPMASDIIYKYRFAAYKELQTLRGRTVLEHFDSYLDWLGREVPSRDSVQDDASYIQLITKKRDLINERIVLACFHVVFDSVAIDVETKCHPFLNHAYLDNHSLETPGNRPPRTAKDAWDVAGQSKHPLFVTFWGIYFIIYEGRVVFATMFLLDAVSVWMTIYIQKKLVVSKKNSNSLAILNYWSRLCNSIPTMHDDD